MPAHPLRVEGDKIVDENGKKVTLRGTAIGGWLKYFMTLTLFNIVMLIYYISMENFITGFPGHESQHRAAMRNVLGQENYEYFFDKWLEYFFTEKDAKFLASLGLNCLRIPFNYRHFEDDMNPRVLKAEGFKHLDRVIDLVRKEPRKTVYKTDH